MSVQRSAFSVERSAPRGAVFLSYASQDSEAARKICDALRSAGIEVWFDQSELRGGDAWDQKIRRQIKECALFVPIISANTNARSEGYFRLEWLLAVERSRLMADDQPFLVPVVIDDTTDPAARVPEKFRDVQWTRFAAGETPTEFCARVKHLLQPDCSRAPAQSAVGGTSGPPGGRSSRAKVAQGVRMRLVFGAAAAFVVATLLIWSRRNEAAGTGDSVARESAAPAAKKSAAPLSPAREWVTKARALYEPWDLATQDDFKQAEEFLKRALELDPSDAEAWAAQAIASFGFVVIGHDATPMRRKALRSQAERAVKLAPASDYARFALALALRLDPDSRADSIRLQRELVARNPGNKLMLRELGAILLVGRNPDGV